MEGTKFYECKVKVSKMQDDGTEKAVTEAYLVDALSYTEAESRITEEMASFYNEFEIANIQRRKYAEIFTSADEGDDLYFKVQLEFVTLDEKTMKEKATGVNYLVQAATLEGAVENTKRGMKGSMIDWVFKGVTRTSILDIFKYVKQDA